MKYYAFEFEGENLVAGPVEILPSATFNKFSVADFRRTYAQHGQSRMLILIRAQHAEQAIDRMVALYYRQVICAQHDEQTGQHHAFDFILPVAAGSWTDPRIFPTP